MNKINPSQKSERWLQITSKEEEEEEEVVVVVGGSSGGGGGGEGWQWYREELSYIRLTLVITGLGGSTSIMQSYMSHKTILDCKHINKGNKTDYSYCK